MYKNVKKMLQILHFLDLDPALDPDPANEINADSFGSGSEILFSVFPE